jgi:hypothetical protein
MRIVIKDSANNQTVLCDGPGRGADKNIGPLDGISFDDQIVTQVAEYLRQSAIQAFNRGNKRTQVQFRVVREMASVNEAHTWQVAFHSACIRQGTVQFIETSNSGVQHTYSLANAVIAGIRSTPLGVSRIVEFTIIGGAIA